MKSILKELLEAQTVLANFIDNEKNIKAINNAANLMSESIMANGKIISCGNGGSMCDAMHFAEELTGKFRDERKPLPAIAISDPSHITCVGNDYGFEHIFSKYIDGLGNSNDVLLAISTSGNSKNILKATQSAKKKKMKVIALTGNHGGKLSEISDVEIRVPHIGYSDRIQEIHIKIIHIIILLIENKIKNEK
jgi:D-sedoheptulose 7-phosphate isomerase|tara:strand:- start:12236 stop:12814 length:579 start_codon:yes stop_codon:yes gene_type:complete